MTCWPPSHRPYPKGPGLFHTPHLAWAPGPRETEGSQWHLWGPSGEGQGQEEARDSQATMAGEKMAIDPAGHATTGGPHRWSTWWGIGKGVGEREDHFGSSVGHQAKASWLPVQRNRGHPSQRDAGRSRHVSCAPPIPHGPAWRLSTAQGRVLSTLPPPKHPLLSLGLKIGWKYPEADVLGKTLNQ